MDNFKKKFLEEATDYIQDLENSLLLLESSPEDKSIIERVFRVMHSLKGGGAMFGFEKISGLTHNLETIYDLIRNNQAKVTEEVLNITFESVDFLKELIKEDAENPELMLLYADFLKKIDVVIANVTSNKNASNNSATKESLVEAVKESAQKTYYVFFKPNSNIFDNGTNPLFLLEDLASLGEIKSIVNLKKIPDFASVNPHICYTSWEVLLVTNADITSIQDVFIFVEDACTLEITELLNTNLLAKENFVKKIDELIASNNDLGVDQLRLFIKELDEDNHKKKEKSGTAVQTKENVISSIRVSSEKLDMLMNLVSELVTTQARLMLYAEKDTSSELMMISENVQKLTRQLRDIAFSIVLIPIENMLTRFNRLIRDLSKELNKDVNFIPQGTDTELDKNIIEGLNDPLMHILRNSLDHGIEDKETRRKLGKPEVGSIILKAYYSGTNVHIKITDDGKGIDPTIIRNKAIEKGIISPETVLTNKEILDFVFLPGFSTAQRVTDISGRGVGMDVVRRKIADIRGEVEIESELNVGTSITIKLPLTLSIIDGLLVNISDVFYIIPLNSVEKIYAIDHTQVTDKFNHIIVLDGEQIPYFYLRKEFQNKKEHTIDVEQIVIIRFEDKKVGLVVDSVVGEYQAVLKTLGKHYKNQEMISGATILGDGTVALVVDTNKMVLRFCAEKQN